MRRTIPTLAAVLLPLLFVMMILFEVAATPNPRGLPQGPTPAAAAKSPVKPTPESQTAAKKIYGDDCAMCHGDTSDGKTDLARDMGLSLSDWTDPRVFAAKSDGEIFDIIRNGTGKMPPEEIRRAKDDDVWNLVIYVRGLAKGNPRTVAAPRQ